MYVCFKAIFLTVIVCVFACIQCPHVVVVQPLSIVHICLYVYVDMYICMYACMHGTSHSNFNDLLWTNDPKNVHFR